MIFMIPCSKCCNRQNPFIGISVKTKLFNYFKYSHVPGQNYMYSNFVKRAIESIESFLSIYLVDRRLQRNFFLPWPVKELSMSSYRICIVAKFLLTNQSRAAMAAARLEAAVWRYSIHSSKNNCEERFNILPETLKPIFCSLLRVPPNSRHWINFHTNMKSQQGLRNHI